MGRMKSFIIDAIDTYEKYLESYPPEVAIHFTAQALNTTEELVRVAIYYAQAEPQTGKD